MDREWEEGEEENQLLLAFLNSEFSPVSIPQLPVILGNYSMLFHSILLSVQSKETQSMQLSRIWSLSAFGGADNG